MTPEDILKQLPGTNCGRCGKSSCDEFALCISNGTARTEMCPYLGDGMTVSFNRTPPEDL
jgi:ArsR family metal-binding transcriptional regulator